MIEQIQELARRRHEAGGVPLRVRLVKGANLAMERTQAELRGWPIRCCRRRWRPTPATSAPSIVS